MEGELPKPPPEGTDPNSHLEINKAKGTIRQIPESDDDGYTALLHRVKKNRRLIGTSTDLVDDSQMMPKPDNLPSAE